MGMQMKLTVNTMVQLLGAGTLVLVNVKNAERGAQSPLAPPLALIMDRVAWVGTIQAILEEVAPKPQARRIAPVLILALLLAALALININKLLTKVMT
jgi:hypothetical protein